MQFPGWDPVLIDIPGSPIAVRWYGLMYVVGFVAAQWILVRLARRGFVPVSVQQAPDLILYCVLGVMLGGRTGYALWYDPTHELILPWNFVQVWKGGLSFHGGLTGVTVAILLFARRRKVPWLRVGDACALAVTPGIFAVRMANFVNGELYGRVTKPDVGWAMQFPTDPQAEQLLGIPAGVSMRERELCIQVAFGHRTWDSVRGQLSDVANGHPVHWDRVKDRLDWQKVREMRTEKGEFLVPYRHPSQLYEGGCEGIALGLLLLLVYSATRRRPFRHGWYGALFLLGYAIARFTLENVREPDDPLKTADHPDGSVLLGMTMGQTLSTFMVVGAALILVLSRRRTLPAPPTDRPAAPAPPAEARA
jgi:phosphatidylglycerol:prolipoprotein diacylglycerol transferase